MATQAAILWYYLTSSPQVCPRPLGGIWRKFCRLALQAAATRSLRVTQFNLRGLHIRVSTRSVRSGYRCEMFPIEVLGWPGGTMGKVFEKTEVRLCASEQGCQLSHLRHIGVIFEMLQAFQYRANGFAKTETAVVRACSKS